jgi:hypothetical protein
MRTGFVRSNGEERVASGDTIGAEVRRSQRGRQVAPSPTGPAIKAYDFEIISTNLPEEQEKQLREAFAQE